jgi:hypothetical protein
MPQVKDLRISEFKELIEQTVEQKLLELLGDPGEGLELRRKIKARLKRSSARERKGIQGITGCRSGQKTRAEMVTRVSY